MPFISPAQLRQMRSRQKMLGLEVLMYQRVMEGLRRNLKFDSLLKLIIDSVREGLGFKRAGLFLLEPDGKSMKLAMGINQYGQYEKHQKNRPLYELTGKGRFSEVMLGKRKYLLTNNYPKVLPHKTWEENLRVRNHALVPIHLGKGQIIGLLAVDNLLVNRPITRSDISALLNYATQVGLALQSAQIQEQMRNLTVTDPLTGLRNRRYFEQTLDMEIKRCQRYGRSCSLLMADLDHFKRVNDRYGHAAGDATLKHVGGLLRDSLRTLDMVARIGGDEFAILLPETPPNNISVVAKRLLRVVRETHLPIPKMNGHSRGVTISLGAASFHRGNLTPQQFIKLADKSLYQAKRRGRNRTGSLQTVSNGF
jgi:diguanylate cyclase (GGDEF)-like protein